MTINALIVDDEEYSRKSLYFLLEIHCPDVKIKGIAKSVAEAKNMLLAGNIDLVFLDISMPIEDGFNLLPDLQKNNSSVIFTTAYDQYGLKALKASAIDYILKPIDIEELKQAVEKAVFVINLTKKNQKSTEIKKTQLQNLEEDINDLKKINKINLPNSNGFQILNVNQILYVSADSNYSIFYLENKESIIVSRHLKEYQELLEQSGFSRIHKSTIINLKHLSDYTNKNGLIVKLSDNSEHVVSRRRSSEFLDTVRNYFRR